MKSGYINGSDLLLSVDDKAIGHSTSHTATFGSETKDRSVKALPTVVVGGAGLFKEKTVTSLSVSVKTEGLRFYDEENTGFAAILKKWAIGSVVNVKLFNRESDDAPYMTGEFVIDSLEESSPAGEDATYSLSISNSGSPTFDDTKADISTVA